MVTKRGHEVVTRWPVILRPPCDNVIFLRNAIERYVYVMDASAATSETNNRRSPGGRSNGSRKRTRTRSRCYIYTINSPRFLLHHYSYICISRGVLYSMKLERGEQGRHHIQAFVRFSSPTDFSVAKTIFKDEQPHIEACKKPKEAYLYCIKDDTRQAGPLFNTTEEEVGGQGRRTDLDEVAQAVLEHKPLVEIAKQHPTSWIKYSRGQYSIFLKAGKIFAVQGTAHMQPVPSAPTVKAWPGAAARWPPSGGRLSFRFASLRDVTYSV